ncbi:MAG: hypothetical protein AB7F41_10680 [Methylocystis sp.]|uniref:hypothetical protein n=1 Tax=Methylocystis sp. TaxID=1911079 RepID=UPI003D0AA0DC
MSPASENKELGRQTEGYAPTDFPGVFQPLSNRDGPPQKQTAVQGAGSRHGGLHQQKAANFHQSEYVGAGRSAIAKLPSRAKLARKWPTLRINRLTWRWRDDASGAKGDDLQSLLVYLGEGAR